ncbi:hypothetical protein T07_11505 [Trichinella nelsoni]|uniref:DUF5641 domain-containing protein n=1 Tax=Trichinella nelsoni TaxID=6336 RepID=A0A0V0SE93_9BILA|nr:hypothetical protein T07_11505 [Trichinella nelsoni]
MTSLPLDINSVWCQWMRELETLESVRVPWALMVTSRDQVRHYELHIFGDASEAAYGAVAYVMMESLDGIKEVRFCLAKTCVAPVKRLNLPRLELMAALLAARLKAYMERELGLPFTDPPVGATVALSSEILSLTEPSQWQHCPTAGNPANKLSRGCALDTLRGDQLWWNGPAWLKEPAEQWPRLTIALSPEETRLASPEKKKVITLCASLQEPSCWTVIHMTTISFLAALRRFIARRGRPSVIHTDNFRTFKQADSFMRDLLHGNTDRAPWCGGYWERLVRSMKNALRKVLGKALLRSWELHTVLCELEARINDRPRTLLSEDPHDCAPLTPAHFLIRRELASLQIPAASTSTPTNASGLRKRWRHQQLLMKHLWNQWLEEYLETLTSREKWTKIGQQPEKGDLVFLVEEGIPRNRCNLGPANKVHVREEELSNENDFYNWIARETEINANSFGALPILTKANYLLVVGNLSAKKLEKDKEKVESVVLAALSDSDEWIRALGDTLKHFLDASSGNFSDDGIPNLAAEFYRDIRDTIIKKTEETTAYLAPEENPTQNIRGYSYCLPLRSEINFVLKRRSKAAAQRASCLEKAAIAVRKQCHKTAVANLANSGTASASSSYFGNILAKGSSLLGRVPRKSLEDIKLKTASSRRDSGIKVLELEETPQHLKIERKEQERKRKEAEKLAKEEQKKLKAKERQEKQLNKAKLKQVKKEQTNIVSSIESDSTTEPKPNNPPGIDSTENA